MISDTMHHCNKCGLCLSVCPVYKALREEHVSPRAKVQLINAHDRRTLPSSPDLQNLVNTCLMCGSCTANCPSGVDHYSRFMEMRTAMVHDHGDRLEIRGLIFLLAREERLRLAAKAAQIGRGILPEALLEKIQPAGIPASAFPTLNKKPFRKQLPESNAQQGRIRGRVLYFTGCATNYMFDQVGHATVTLLTAMGYAVDIPKGQTCCSLPMLFHGAGDKADANIKANLKALDRDDIEAVIVDCPTCGSALKDHYPDVAEHYGLDAAKTNAMAGKVIDLMSFIHDRLDQLQLSHQADAGRTPVTYHTPCHLKNSFTPADRILKAIPGIDYRPAPDSRDCCGGGGTFFYEYPEISKKITGTKVDNAVKTGARIWLTDCPVCAITLSGRLDAEHGIEVTHPACFLASLL